MENDTLILSFLTVLIFQLIYYRFTGDLKLFKHEYFTYEYPDDPKIEVICYANDAGNTHYIWSKDVAGSTFCVISAQKNPPPESTRKLDRKWTSERVTELEGLYGVDLEDELARILIEEIKK